MTIVITTTTTKVTTMMRLLLAVTLLLSCMKASFVRGFRSILRIGGGSVPSRTASTTTMSFFGQNSLQGRFLAESRRESSSPSPSSSSSSSALQVYFTSRMMDNGADFLVEQFMGGERYEMTVLPDSMVATTLFVGNLNEFVVDDDLSKLFQRASHLQYIPACVIRKPDMTSLEYGFVTFPSVEEKEAALLRFHGYKWRGKRLKVEPIRDHTNSKTGKPQRVRIPERMVTYVSGVVKKASFRGKNKAAASSSLSLSLTSVPVNTMRRATTEATTASSSSTTAGVKQNDGTKPDSSSSKYISVKSVTAPAGTTPKKRRSMSSAQLQDYRKVLKNGRERAEYERATRKGFITFAGGRKHLGGGSWVASSLSKLFRQWCDNRFKPNIRLYKATNGRSMDQVMVDISPQHVYSSLVEKHGDLATEMLRKKVLQYKVQVHDVATSYGMVVASNENSDSASDNSDSIDELGDDRPPLWQLPVLNIGTFQGERAQSKAVAKDLAQLWDISTDNIMQSNRGSDFDNSRGSSSSRNNRRRHGHGGDDDHHESGAGGRRRNKTKGLSRHRTRGGGHRQSWY